MNWFYLSIAIVSEVIATSALKASNGFTEVYPMIIVAMGYLSSFYFLSLTLRTIPIGIAYAVWSGVGLMLITTVGAYVYNQKLDFPAIVGISLIVLGVFVLGFYSKATIN